MGKTINVFIPTVRILCKFTMPCFSCSISLNCNYFTSKWHSQQLKKTNKQKTHTRAMIPIFDNMNEAS